MAGSGIPVYDHQEKSAERKSYICTEDSLRGGLTSRLSRGDRSIAFAHECNFRWKTIRRAKKIFVIQYCEDTMVKFRFLKIKVAIYT